MIFFLYLLVLTGFIFSRGFFSFNGIFILLLAIGLFILINFSKALNKVKLISAPVLLLFLSILSLVMYGGLYQSNYLLVFVSLGLLALNTSLAFSLLIDISSDKRWKVYLAMFVIAVLVRLFMIWSSPAPAIDVYDYLKNGALGFMHGQNPYSMQFTQLYPNVTPDFYSYLPGMLFLTLPSVAVFTDPRFAVFGAEILSALLIFYLAKKKETKYIYALLFLNNPVSLYMIEQSYTEPLVFFLMLYFAFLLIKKRNTLAAVVLGVLFATKQYAILLLPLIWRLAVSSRHRLPGSVIAFLAAGIIILPFFFWNKADFLHDAVFLQYNFAPRYEGLSFFSLLYRFGLSYNFIASAVTVGLFMVFIWLGKQISFFRFFYLSAFMYLVFFFFNKWAFINYYYLVSQLVLVAAVCKEENL